MSRPRTNDPRRIDVAAAAADGVSLEGRWPVAAMERLAADVVGDARGADVRWTAVFELRQAVVGAPQIWLHLRAAAGVACECQRCLQPVAVDLAIDRQLRFVATEEEAAALDADSEDDVLALSRTMDLQSLVEDELLMALPLVPRHEDCPVPLTSDTRAPASAPSPFAALAALKARRGA